MSGDAKARRQQAAITKAHGEPIVAISFFGYPDGHVSMWQHTNHAADFSEAQDLLLEMQSHLARFIADGAMCPYHPDFPQLDKD